MIDSLFRDLQKSFLMMLINDLIVRRKLITIQDMQGTFEDEENHSSSTEETL